MRLIMLAYLVSEDARGGHHVKAVLKHFVVRSTVQIVDICQVCRFLLQVLLATVNKFFQVVDPVDDNEAVLVLAHATEKFS